MSAPPSGILFYEPRAKPLSVIGQQQPGAYYQFYLTGTTTPATVYADGLLTVPLSQTPGTGGTTAAADGRLVPIYLDPAVIYRVQLYNKLAVLLEDTDPYIPNTLNSAEAIGKILYPRTAAELAAGVIPTKYEFPPGVVERYGADPTGTSDSSPAFDSAFLVTGNIIAVGNYLINTQVTMDISTTTLTGPAVLTSGVTASNTAVILVTASLQPEDNVYHKIDGIKFVGNNTSSVSAIIFRTTNPLGVCNFKVNSCAFTLFTTGIFADTGAFEIQFDGCSFSSCGTGFYDHFAASERMSFVQCAFFNNTINGFLIDGGGEAFFDNCSMDYNSTHINASNGNVFLSNCYFESNTDTNYWFIASNATAGGIWLNGGMIVQTGAKSNFAIGYSNNTQSGGIYFDSVKFFSNTNSIITPIIAGDGIAIGKNCVIDGFTNLQTAWTNFSLYQNFCSNGTFQNGTGGLGGWTLFSTDSALPVVSPANTLKMQTDTGGNGMGAYWSIAAEMGDVVGFTCVMQGNLSTAQFGMTMRAVGNDGTTLKTTGIEDNFNSFNGSTSPCPTVPTQVRCLMISLPPGTSSVQFEVNTLGATSAANIISVQDVVVGKY